MFLNALKGENREGRPPVWLMRQAGRYLPQYQLLRQKHSLKTLFCTPELAVKITRMPVDILEVDAAILFSDITLIAMGFGLELDFQEGPVVFPHVTPELLPHLPFLPEKLDPIILAAKYAKQEIPVPLIGFCGGPFTVATYFSDAKLWLNTDPTTFHAFLEKLTDLSIVVLQRQIAAGIDAVQIFDSWVADLSYSQFEQFCLPYLKKLIAALSCPVIFFMRGGAAFADLLPQLGAAAISCDWQCPLAKWRRFFPDLALQGNLDPDLLLTSPAIIQQKTEALLLEMESDPAFILNLGHGVKPNTPVAHVKQFVDVCKRVPCP